MTDSAKVREALVRCRNELIDDGPKAVKYALQECEAAIAALEALSPPPVPDGDALKALDDIEQLIREVRHAQSVGSAWYTKGASGLYQQISMWLGKGHEAAKKLRQALHPAQPVGEPSRKRALHPSMLSEADLAAIAKAEVPAEAYTPQRTAEVAEGNACQECGTRRMSWQKYDADIEQRAKELTAQSPQRSAELITVLKALENWPTELMYQADIGYRRDLRLDAREALSAFGESMK